MKNSILVIALVAFASPAAFAAQSYQCVGKDSAGEKITGTLEVDGQSVVFNGEAATLDAKYRPRTRQDMVRFLFAKPDCGESCTVGVIVSKEVLQGAPKVFATQEYTGETFEADHYVCFAK